MNELHEKVKSALAEQDGNFIHIHNALEKLEPYLPIVPAHLDDRDVVQHIDQMIFRFMKIQDGMGRRLIPLIAEVIEADTSEMTFMALLKFKWVRKVIYDFLTQRRGDAEKIATNGATRRKFNIIYVFAWLPWVFGSRRVTPLFLVLSAPSASLRQKLLQDLLYPLKFQQSHFYRQAQQA